MLTKKFENNNIPTKNIKNIYTSINKILCVFCVELTEFVLSLCTDGDILLSASHPLKLQPCKTNSSKKKTIYKA